METHQLTSGEYAKIERIVAQKRSTKELLETLKRQLAADIIQEDRWWNQIARKYSLDPASYAYSINHQNKEIVGNLRPIQTQAPQQPVQKQPAQPEITVRERTPEMNKLVSQDELEAMRQAREATTDDN